MDTPFVKLRWSIRLDTYDAVFFTGGTSISLNLFSMAPEYEGESDSTIHFIAADTGYSPNASSIQKNCGKSGLKCFVISSGDVAQIVQHCHISAAPTARLTLSLTCQQQKLQVTKRDYGCS